MGFVRYPDGDSGMFPDYHDPVNLDDHLTGAYVFVNLIWIYKKKSSVLESESITLLYDQMLQMRDPNCAKSEMKCYLEVNQMMIKNDFQDGGKLSN